MEKDFKIITTNQARTWNKLCNGLFFAKKPENHTIFFSWGALYLLFVFWGLSFMNDVNFETDPYGASDSILHTVSLVFHEAGHVIFRPFGRLIHFFGGSFFQCLVPVIFIIKFVRMKDMFGASISLWALGFNLLDVAPYIYDAFDKKLLLISGGTGVDMPDTHDWSVILTITNKMLYHDSLAYAVGNIGRALIILSIVWGGIILKRQLDLLRKENHCI